MKFYTVVAAVLVLVALSVPATAAFAQGPWDPPVLQGDCYGPWHPDASDYEDIYVMPYTNSYHNATMYYSADHTCTGSIATYLTVVTAVTRTEAEDICTAVQPMRVFGTRMGAHHMWSEQGFTTAPTNLWICF